MLSYRGRSDILGGIGAVVILVVTVVPLGLPIWVGIPVAVVAYVALRLIIPAPKEVVAGMTAAEAQRTIRDGEAKVSQIRSLAHAIPRKPVQERVLRIAGVADDIYADFKDDPKDIAQMPDFAASYLDPLIKVLQQYSRLAARPVAGDNDTLAKIENEVLPKVETAFGGLYQQLIADDVVDLDAASEGLKSLMDVGSA